MKFLAVLCIILFAFAFASANNHGCNNSPCGHGHICYTMKGQCSCIETSRCLDVTLTQKVMAQWGNESGKNFTQYDVTIANNLMFDITDIFIGTDATLTLRDYESIWNINRLPNGEMKLPSYQQSINKNSTYTFGFIISGNQHPNMAILAVTY